MPLTRRDFARLALASGAALAGFAPGGPGARSKSSAGGAAHESEAREVAAGELHGVSGYRAEREDIVVDRQPGSC